MNVGSTSVNQLTCFAGRSLSWMLGHSAQIGKRQHQGHFLRRPRFKAILSRIVLSSRPNMPLLMTPTQHLPMPASVVRLHQLRLLQFLHIQRSVVIYIQSVELGGH